MCVRACVEGEALTRVSKLSVIFLVAFCNIFPEFQHRDLERLDLLPGFCDLLLQNLDLMPHAIRGCADIHLEVRFHGLGPGCELEGGNGFLQAARVRGAGDDQRGLVVSAQ